MNPQKLSALVAVCGTLGFLGGCATEPDSVLVTAPPPAAPTTSAANASGQVVYNTQQPQQMVVTQPQQVVTTGVVPGTVNSYLVVQAPPAPQPEAVPERPSTRHLWIPGYWTWQNSRYAWMAGHWEVPPFSGANWVNPRAVSEGGAFRFYEGYWN